MVLVGINCILHKDYNPKLNHLEIIGLNIARLKELHFTGRV